MKKKVLLGLVCATLMSTGVSAADTPKEIAPMRFDMTRPYAGQDVTVTHDQVMANLKELNNLLEKSPGWAGAGMATTYKQYYERKDAIFNGIVDATPEDYKGKVKAAYAVVELAYKKKLGEAFGITNKYAIDLVFEEIVKAEKEGRAVNTSTFDEKQIKLYEATTLAFHVRTAETDLINAFPKALEKGNEMIEAINENTKGIAANKKGLEGKADKTLVDDHTGLIEKNKTDIATNKGLIDANTGKIDTNTAAIKTNADAITANKTAVDEALAGKADKSVVDGHTTAIQKNTDDIAANGKLIEENAAAVKKNEEALKTKADKTDVQNAKDIKVGEWRTKLGGKAEEGDAGFVTGDQVVAYALEATALDGEVAEDNTKTGVTGAKVYAAVKAEKDARMEAEKAIVEKQASVDAAQNSRMDGLQTSIERTGALTGALAGLKPVTYDPMAPTQAMGAVATYKGEQGYALGVAHYTREDLMLHAGVAYDGHDEFMGNIGVTMKIGRKGEGVPARYAAGPISSIYVLQQENEELKARIERLEMMMEEKY